MVPVRRLVVGRSSNVFAPEPWPDVTEFADSTPQKRSLVFELLAFVGDGADVMDVAATGLLVTAGATPDPAVEPHATAAIAKTYADTQTNRRSTNRACALSTTA